MKTIGLLGGMSWESTATYYATINTGIKERLGGLHSAKIAMYSVDFAEVERLQMAGQWTEAGRLLAQAAQSIERAGADGLLICTNTMHKVAEEVACAIHIPLLHIVDATAKELQRAKIKKIGLLGTIFTMEESFYKGRLEDHFGIEVLVPEAEKRKQVNDIIYNELCLGIIKDDSRKCYLKIIEQLTQKGAQGIILGCTEIGLLVQQEHCKTPLYDTTHIHAMAAVDFALAETDRNKTQSTSTKRDRAKTT